jgi:hypothetical protein
MTEFQAWWTIGCAFVAVVYILAVFLIFGEW